MRITPGDDVVMDFNPYEGDRLTFGGQSYQAVTTADGIVITLSDASGATTGHVTLWQVHTTFDSSWVV
ncbi:MAG TPA: hypothetical protein VHG30_15360 [Microvirga sp.]|nr:hypothetical protein [Microvirga sp.]